LVGFLGRGISPAPRPLPTQDNTTQHRETDTHPRPEQDSNLRSQCSSGRRQYLPRPRGQWNRQPVKITNENNAHHFLRYQG
jgi:hypothetical protein